jgi:hypothetical protein
LFIFLIIPSLPDANHILLLFMDEFLVSSHGLIYLMKKVCIYSSIPFVLQEKLLPLIQSSHLYCLKFILDLDLDLHYFLLLVIMVIIQYVSNLMGF